MKDFLREMGSVINLFPSDRSVTLLPKHSDADAIKSDWEKAGNDMRLVAEKNHSQKIKQKPHAGISSIVTAFIYGRKNQVN